MAYIRINSLDMNGGDVLHELADNQQAAIARAKQLINGNERNVATVSNNGQGMWNVWFKDIQNTKPIINNAGTSIFFGAPV
jgi:hypothetical protein